MRRLLKQENKGKLNIFPFFRIIFEVASTRSAIKTDWQ
jgi:hypothetical protein